MARGLRLVLVALLLVGSLPLTLPPASAAEAKPLSFGLPQPTVGASAAQVGDAVYVLGGRLADGTYSNQILRIDPSTGANATVATFPPVTIAPGSSERYSGSVATFGSKIYYFGGATAVQGTVGGQPARLPKPIPDIVVYDTASGSPPYVLSQQVGKQGQALPGEGAWGMSEVTIGSVAYLFGGFTLDLSTYNFQRHDWILAFDMSSETIKQLAATLPYPVQDAGAAYVSTPASSRVYLFGGLANNNTANLCPGRYADNGTYQRPSLCLTDEIIRWDPATQTDAVVDGTTLPYRVQFANAAATRNGKAYVLGGLLVDGTASQAILEFNPASTTPLRTLTPTLDPGLFGSGITADGSTISLWGGRTGEANQLTASVVRFDPGPTAPFSPFAPAAARSATGIHVSWQPPTYDGGSPVTGYNLSRVASDGTTVWLTPRPTTSLAFDDSTVRPGENYTYVLVALNSYGASSPARISTATAVTPPGAVSRFSIYAGNDEAVLTWAAPAENGGTDLTGYHIACNCSDRPVSVDAGTTAYAWTGLTNGVTYAFQVYAVNAKGQGASSPTLHATPAPVPDAPASVQAQPAGGSGSDATGIVVSWIPPASPPDRFLVLRGTTPDAITQPVANLTSDQSTFTDQAVQTGGTYYYAVVSLNNAGTSPPALADPVSLVDPPGAPGNVKAVGMEGLVQITWDAPQNLGHAEPNAITYIVTRTSPGATLGKIISPPGLRDTGFSDRAATPGLTYTYTVTAQNPRRGAPSDPVTAVAKVVTNKPPVAALTILPAIATAGDPVTLDASQSADPDGQVVSYTFDFGDQSDPVRTTTSSVTHQYATNGTYAATVVVTDDRGNVSTPVSARVIVGTLVGSGTPDSGGDLTGKTPPSRPITNAGASPGGGTGKLVPAPELALVALVAVGLARVTRRHLRR